MHPPRRILLAVLSALALSFAACGGDPDPVDTPSVITTTTDDATTDPGSTPDGDATGIEGTWNGSFASELGATGTFVVEFTQNGDQIVGEIDIQGSTCISHGDIAGTLSGDDIAFGAVEGVVTITFTGTLDGDHLEGEYQAPDEACGPDSGEWEADRAA
jgi:hypothetical protein